MSMNATHYTIIGYDLTGFQTDKFNDWRWTEEGERCFDSQLKGYIQLFDDPSGGKHLYFGYILSNNDGYGDDTVFSMTAVQRQIPYVHNKLKELVGAEVVSDDVDYRKIQFISFVEWI